VKTGDTDDENDEQVDDWGSEFRCGGKMMLGNVVKTTKTEWCRRRLWQLFLQFRLKTVFLLLMLHVHILELKPDDGY